MERPLKQQRITLENGSVVRLDKLSKDMIFNMAIEEFTYRDVAMLEKLSRRYRSIVFDRQVWFHIFKRDYPRMYNFMKDENNPRQMNNDSKFLLDRYSKNPKREKTYWKRAYESNQINGFENQTRYSVKYTLKNLFDNEDDNVDTFSSELMFPSTDNDQKGVYLILSRYLDTESTPVYMVFIPIKNIDIRMFLPNNNADNIDVTLSVIPYDEMQLDTQSGYALNIRIMPYIDLYYFTNGLIFKEPPRYARINPTFTFRLNVPYKFNNLVSSSMCSFCNISDTVNLKQCAGCKQAKYCSKECQINDWKQHKKDCK